MQRTGQNANTSQRHILLLAKQPPESGRKRVQAAQLATMLANAGLDVETAAEGAQSYVQTVLAYHTKKRFAKTRTELAAAVTPESTLVVFASALGTENVDKPLFRPLLSQWVRRFRLARDTARGAGSTLFIMDAGNPLRGGFWVALAFGLWLLPRSGARLTFTTAPTRLFRRISGKTAPLPTQKTAIDGVFKLSFRNGRIPSISLPPAEQTAITGGLENLAALCNDKAVRMSINLQFFARIPPRATACFPPDPLRDFANTPATGDPLTRIMRHTRDNLPDRSETRVCKNMDDADFRRWYVTAPFVDTITPPLPVPRESQRELARARPETESGTLATILKLAARGDSLSDMPDAALARFSAPVTGQGNALSTMEMIVAVLAGYPARTRALAENPWQSDEIRQWFASVICPAFPALRRFSTAPPQPDTPAPTIKISGIVNGDGGLARNARMHAATLTALGPDVALHARGALPLPEWHRGSGARAAKRAMILHNINAHRTPDLVLSRALHNGENPLHVGYLLWELETVPPAHKLAGEMLDEIWVPSRFVQQAYETAYGRKVHNVGKAIQLPATTAADLSHLGILPEHRLFLLVFDVNSSVERKNPLAAVRAFLAAFPDTPDVRLLIKTTDFHESGRGDITGQIATIEALAAKDPRIVIERAYLPFTQLLGRILRADCIVSAHRAEGFGYIPAFALKLGRPVIVTDYSGTQDFCTPETAFVVPHGWSAPRFIPVFSTVEGARWAEVDIHEMARQMQAVLGDPKAAGARAKRGQTLVNRLYAPERLEKTYLERLQALGVL